MTRSSVLVTSRSYSSGRLDLVKQLSDAGADIVRAPAEHDLDGMGPYLYDAVAWIAGTGPITAEHLDRAPRLMLIARYGVGTDAVDLVAAQRRGVLITNTPGANSDAVAEHALALILAALRHVVAGDRAVRSGDWSVQRTAELRNVRVGIVGFGRIGRALAARLQPFGTTIVAVDPALTSAQIEQARVRSVPWEQLSSQVDVISLHAPGGRQLIDRQWLSSSPGNLILVNTARAALVDEHALAAALREGRLATYAADDIGSHHVTECGGDSGGAGDGPVSPLLAADIADRVILTPHTAAQTVEAVDKMGAAATDAVLAVLAGRLPPNLITPPADGSY